MEPIARGVSYMRLASQEEPLEGIKNEWTVPQRVTLCKTVAVVSG